MSDSLILKIQQMSSLILRPLVRLLLKHGVSHRTLEQQVRHIFVSEAEELLRDRDTKPTVSSLAVLTGLSRKEVKRILETDFKGIAEETLSRNRVVRTLSAWCNHEDFSSEGAPNALATEGENSFAELVRRFSGDMTPAAMLATLLHSENVIQINGRLCLQKKEYLPLETSHERLMLFGTDTAELMGTIEHNLENSNDNRWFQGKVSSHLLHRDAVPEFRALSNRKSMEMLEYYDYWLSKHEVEEGDPNGSYVAVGIYYTQNQGEAEK